jgi:primase-like protein
MQGGNFAYYYWYRHSEERRRIRPWGDDLPIDLLGSGGFVIAPPSTTGRGSYEFIQGSLDEVRSLRSMHGLGPSLYNDAVTIVPDDVLAKDAVAEAERSIALISEGRRNETLFAHCMRHANHCEDRDTLLDMTRTFNERCVPPLSDDEVNEIVNSALRYTALGENRFGTTGSWLPTHTVHALVADPYLCTLINFLQAENRPNRTFMVADGLAKRLCWARRRFQAARRAAVKRGFIEMVSKPNQGHPALYRFGSAIPRGGGARAKVSIEDSQPILAGLEKVPTCIVGAPHGRGIGKRGNRKRKQGLGVGTRRTGPDTATGDTMASAREFAVDRRQRKREGKERSRSRRRLTDSAPGARRLRSRGRAVVAVVELPG